MNPKVTILFASFNHERFVADSVQSCLNQDYQPLKIYFSDDCSSDKTFEIITEIVGNYTGPHEVVLNRNDHNRYLDHIPDLVDQISEDFCVFAAGDDVHYPYRVSALTEAWRNSGASLIASAARIIDAAGAPIGVHNVHRYEDDTFTLERFLRTGYNPTCFGASLACEKDLLRAFPMRNLGSRNEDFYLPFRALLLKGGAHLNTPLLDWRNHGSNTTLALKHQNASTELEKMLLEECDLLNRVANWHLVISDAGIMNKKDLLKMPFNIVANYAFQHINAILTAWRPLRTRIANTKAGSRTSVSSPDTSKSC